MKIVFVSSYIPRKCGIATYTNDLTQELIKQGHTVRIVELKNSVTSPEPNKLVTRRIEQDAKSEYLKAAQELNLDDSDIIHIQHEFGLFGGADGEYILEMAAMLKKPLFVTFHTILETPTVNQKYIIQELGRISRGTIVMEEIAKDRLVQKYGFNEWTISVILHGVPDIGNINRDDVRKKLKLDKSFTLLISNLISRNKGIEYAIGAMPSISKEIPNAKLVILGETHPVVKLNEGESYRKELEKLVETLEVKKYVTFINEYVSLDKLKEYLASADICITPYLDPQQITSGTLSYAIGAGKASISTPFVYAKNILSEEKGILVPFKDSNAIATAVIDLYSNKGKRSKIEKKANSLRQEMLWKKVALNHSKFYKTVLEKYDQALEQVPSFIQKKISLEYLEFLTDYVGMMQHTFYSLPERKFGYSTDDNARALVVIAMMSSQLETKKLTSLLVTYSGFLRLAQEESGQFHTFLNFQRLWIDNHAVADPYGKSMWALGASLYLLPPSPLTKTLNAMFNISIEQTDNIKDLRTAANTILGLFYYINVYKGKKDAVASAEEKLKKLADFLIFSYEKHSEPNWHWFENTMTYDNFRIPLALFATYLITSRKEYLDVAEKSLAFVKKCNFNNDFGYFDFVGQRGWHSKNGKKANFDQQPLEAASAVETYVFAYQVTKKKEYLIDAHNAFAWFFGKNRNNRMLYNQETKGVYDGLTLTGVNENQGAESIVCFLIAWLSLKKISKKIKN
jgi:glycosyltransferase involved in cell wall biosynthesis